MEAEGQDTEQDKEKQIRDELSRHYQSMKSTIKKEREERKALYGQYREREREMSNTTSQLSSAQSTITQYQTEIQRYQTEIQRLRRELSNMNEILASRDAEIRRQDKSIREKMIEIQSLRNQIDMLGMRLSQTQAMNSIYEIGLASSQAERLRNMRTRDMR
jgi:chromosome segregation ATPase